MQHRRLLRDLGIKLQEKVSSTGSAKSTLSKANQKGTSQYSVWLEKFRARKGTPSQLEASPKKPLSLHEHDHLVSKPPRSIEDEDLWREAVKVITQQGSKKGSYGAAMKIYKLKNGKLKETKMNDNNISKKLNELSATLKKANPSDYRDFFTDTEASTLGFSSEDPAELYAGILIQEGASDADILKAILELNYAPDIATAKRALNKAKNSGTEDLAALFAEGQLYENVQIPTILKAMVSEGFSKDEASAKVSLAKAQVTFIENSKGLNFAIEGISSKVPENFLIKSLISAGFADTPEKASKILEEANSILKSNDGLPETLTQGVPQAEKKDEDPLAKAITKGTDLEIVKSYCKAKAKEGKNTEFIKAFLLAKGWPADEASSIASESTSGSLEKAKELADSLLGGGMSKEKLEAALTLASFSDSVISEALKGY